ncbi:hypothetical protein ACFVWG_23860 [Kribbella sp. NPDC058245]|uniref:hypothetical protein n=1 Tax=Kribbella sp. NPDC058245 TaxID=3346399 RepID=UPI0036E898A6
MAKPQLLKPVAVEDLPGDPDKTRERAKKWSAGQKLCRRRKRHHWKRFHSIAYGKDINRPGTRVKIVERCPDCTNRRSADHQVISLGKRSRGLRRLDDHWVIEYRDVNGIPYLLEKGSQAIWEDLVDELYADEFYANPGRVIYVADEEAA